MVRCTTCSLLIRESRIAFAARVGGDEKAEAFNHALVIDRESNDPFPFVAVYCYAERPEFIQQLGTELRTDEIQEHELFNREHDCVFYQPGTGHYDLEYAINLYNEQRVAMTMTPVTNIVAGGTFIQSQVGVVNSSLDGYIRALDVNAYCSDAERELKSVLAELRRSIEIDESLTPAQRQAAASDIAIFTEEMSKPEGVQSADTKSVFWDRLNTVTNASSALNSLVQTIGRMTGLL